MRPFWEAVIEPLLTAMEPTDIVEIGSEFGGNTQKLLEFCVRHRAVLHAIDPEPRFDVDKWLNEHGSCFQFHRALSLNALPLIKRVDVVLIDGDHNWYTVFHELKLIEQISKASGDSFPVVLVHDVGWPYGRRDLYYNPETIPLAYRKPYKQKGTKPGSPELQESGGLNPELHHSIYENNLQNGVLTAVEDFVRESAEELDLLYLAPFHGLAILVPRPVRLTKPAVDRILTTFQLPQFGSELIESLERNRVDLKVALSDTTSRLRLEQGTNTKLQQQMSDMTAALETAEVELGSLRSDFAARVAEVATLRQECTEQAAAITRILGELSSVKTTLADREAAYEVLKSRSSELGVALELSQSQLTTARQELDEKTTAYHSLQQELTQRTSSLERVQAELSLVKADLSAREAAFDAIQAELTQTTSSLEHAHSELSLVKADWSAKEVAFDSLHQELTQTTTSLEHARTELSLVKADLSTKEAAFDALEATHLELIALLEQRETALTVAQESLTRMDADFRALQEERTTSSHQIVELQRTLSVTENELSKRTSDLESAQKQVGEAYSSLLQAEAQVSTLTKQLADLHALHTDDSAQLSKWVEDLDEIVSALIDSKRWKVGHAIAEAVRRSLLKPPGRLATEHRDKVMGRYRAWKSRPVPVVSHRPTVSTSTRIQLPATGQKPAMPEHPKVSVVAAVLNKAESLTDFVTAFAGQSYPGEIELVLVDDGSGDQSVEIIECLTELFSKPGKLGIRLVRNHKNLGNCGSRNKGLLHATGSILTVMDADCIVNETFVSEHVKAHLQGFDICIGPMGIESLGRDVPQLHQALMSDDRLLEKEMRLQYPDVPTSFVNCVTRNFSITKAFLDVIKEPLFDESFSYSKDSDSGFGWEDVEMGYRSYLAGARIWYARKAISIHKTHEPEVPDSIKAPRSARNFARLLRKHPQLIQVLPQWVHGTYGKIHAWLLKYDPNKNQDLETIAAMLEHRATVQGG